jgi:hypothetical protein
MSVLWATLSLLLETDLSRMNDSSIVDAVRNLEPFLPSGCEMMGQGDLKIVGSRPIGAGGSQTSGSGRGIMALKSQ